ncbi:hypothetical protein B0T14DRAFT_569746 [Immersiella caudata]|uniref:Uncharacterized protein n=1 Tax=Immersiella caudata TaxID=314043 RepID=A0AA39WE64_9PEZI|nr:hypothetical protein B0T14DRAFT_569746 [Immersiella caudata]
MIPSAILAGIVMLASGVVSTPHRKYDLTSRAPLPGFNLKVLEWTAQATPGGETINVNGTVQDVVAALNKIDPQYEARLRQDTSLQSRSLDESYFYKRKSYDCIRIGSRGVDPGEIKDGIRYLRTVSGRPKNGPGPGNCGRISCSWASAIYWCNEDESEKELDTFARIADAASFLVQKCWDGKRGSGFGGTVIHEDNWSVVIKFDGENC